MSDPHTVYTAGFHSHSQHNKHHHHITRCHTVSFQAKNVTSHHLKPAAVRAKHHHLLSARFKAFPAYCKQHVHNIKLSCRNAVNSRAKKQPSWVKQCSLPHQANRISSILYLLFLSWPSGSTSCVTKRVSFYSKPMLAVRHSVSCLA